MNHRTARLTLAWLLQSLAAIGTCAAVEPPRASAQDQQVSAIASILQARCVSCHGASKQEGGYRLDTLNWLQKSGDSGKQPLIAGAPERSEILTRLTSDDADQRMPPEGPALSAAQIELVRTWIASGAEVAEHRASLPLAAIALASNPRKAPEHYPSPLPVSALALDTHVSEQVHVWTSGRSEVLHWLIENDQSVQLVGRLPVSGTHISAIDISSDRKHLAVASGLPGSGGVVELFSLEPSLSAPTWSHLHADLAGDIAFAPNAATLAIGQSDGSLLRVELATDSAIEIQSITPHADAINCVAWSHDGQRLITGSRDRTAKIFRAERLELIANYDRHDRSVGGVAYIGTHPATFDETGRLRIWTGDENDKTIAENDSKVRFLQRITADNDHVWLPRGGQVITYQLEKKTVDDGQDEQGKPKTKTTTRLKSTLEYESKRPNWLLTVVSDGSWLAAGSESGEVVIWKHDSPQPHVRFRAQP